MPSAVEPVRLDLAVVGRLVAERLGRLDRDARVMPTADVADLVRQGEPAGALEGEGHSPKGTVLASSRQQQPATPSGKPARFTGSARRSSTAVTRHAIGSAGASRSSSRASRALLAPMFVSLPGMLRDRTARHPTLRNQTRPTRKRNVHVKPSTRGRARARRRAPRRPRGRLSLALGTDDVASYVSVRGILRRSGRQSESR